MNCSRCGAEISYDLGYCPHCGAEIQIVPDYNPWEDMLTAELKGAINTGNITYFDRRERASDTFENTEDISPYSSLKYEEEPSPEYSNDEYEENQTAAFSNFQESVNMEPRGGWQTPGQKREEAEQPGTVYQKREEPMTAVREPEQSVAAYQKQPEAEAAYQGREQSEAAYQERGLSRDEARRRQRIARRRAVQRKKRRLLFGGIVFGGLFLFSLVFLVSNTSYGGQVKKGYRLLERQEYEGASAFFKKAIAKKKTKADAYIGLSSLYEQQENLDSAESVLLDALNANPQNIDLYKAVIQFYIDTDQDYAIPVLLDECDQENVLAALKEYKVKTPKFSLKESTFDEVQELSISTKEKGREIFYTTDGSEPAVSGTKYEGPIQIGEGATTVRAVAVNKKGIPSLTTEKTYTVELPLASAPSVRPATGEYSEYTMIEVKVPDGYTAYYTMNGGTPSEDSEDSIEYTEPIEMPEGKTLFSVVLIDRKGKASRVTKRNYNLVYDGYDDSYSYDDSYDTDYEEDYTEEE